MTIYKAKLHVFHLKQCKNQCKTEKGNSHACGLEHTCNTSSTLLMHIICPDIFLLLFFFIKKKIPRIQMCNFHNKRQMNA